MAKLNFKGVSGKGRGVELKKVLENYSLDAVKEFFALPVASNSKRDLYQ